MIDVRVASAKASSLISFGTAFGILRKQCLLVEPKLVRPHTNSTKQKTAHEGRYFIWVRQAWRVARKRNLTDCGGQLSDLEV